MHQKRRCWTNAAVALVVAGLLIWPATTLAHLGSRLSPRNSNTSGATVVGTASAVRATTLGLLGLGTTTALSDTGTLGQVGDFRDASQNTGSVASLLTGEVLSAATFSYPNEVDSEASLANLGLTIPGATIIADSVIAQASQVMGAAGTGSSTISNLSVNGIPVVVSGYPNQTIAIPGGQMIINEQTVSSTGTAVVNALHVVVNGVADVVIASATAGIS
ncbi:MAG: hypothetical protein AUG89_13810 [Acidobacteria bacterium 13_1_20CM_4_56_7]|jgi:hypothetical protein|nr:MAG: hypothetical protein AUG89_13810 [Acidobacteria bacterium 13_1_20CM_4_56_7]